MLLETILSLTGYTVAPCSKGLIVRGSGRTFLYKGDYQTLYRSIERSLVRKGLTTLSVLDNFDWQVRKYAPPNDEKVEELVAVTAEPMRMTAAEAVQIIADGDVADVDDCIVTGLKPLLAGVRECLGRGQINLTRGVEAELHLGQVASIAMATDALLADFNRVKDLPPPPMNAEQDGACMVPAPAGPVVPEPNHAAGAVEDDLDNDNAEGPLAPVRGRVVSLDRVKFATPGSAAKWIRAHWNDDFNISCVKEDDFFLNGWFNGLQCSEAGRKKILDIVFGKRATPVKLSEFPKRVFDAIVSVGGNFTADPSEVEFAGLYLYRRHKGQLQWLRGNDTITKK